MICATKPRIRYVQTLADYGVTPTGRAPDDGQNDPASEIGFSIFLDTEPDPREAEAGRAAPAMLLTPGGVVRVPVGVDVANFVTALARLDAAVPFIGLDDAQDTATPGRLGFRSLPDGSLALSDADGTTATIDGRPVILTLTDLETFANRSGPITAAERNALTGKGPAADVDATGGDDPTLSAAIAGTATLAIPQMVTPGARIPIDSLIRGGLKLSGIGTFIATFLDSTPLNQGENDVLSRAADADLVEDMILQSTGNENGEGEADDDDPPPAIPDNSASQPNPDGGEDPDEQDPEQNLRDSDARSQAARFVDSPKGPVRVPTDEEVLAAGRQPGKNGMSRATVALQKHADRPRRMYPKLEGSLQQRNQQGERVLNEILKSPNRFVRATKNGDVEIWDLNTGRGVRMTRDNKMYGYLCPTRTIEAMMR